MIGLRAGWGNRSQELPRHRWRCTKRWPRWPKAKPDDPIFPSKWGKPDGGIIEKLKAAAYRAKLNCGYCVLKHKLDDGSIRINRCSEGPYCQRWFLHKFRHTFATRHLQSGVDIETLRVWMGHSNVAITMIYLTPNEDVQEKVNNGKLAAFA